MSIAALEFPAEVPRMPSNMTVKRRGRAPPAEAEPTRLSASLVPTGTPYRVSRRSWRKHALKETPERIGSGV